MPISCKSKTGIIYSAKSKFVQGAWVPAITVCVQGLSPSDIHEPLTIPSVLSVSFEPENYYLDMSLVGNVTSDGGSPIIERGVVWNYEGEPTISDNKLEVPGTLGEFEAIYQSENFSENFARAYATNALGTAYGSVLNAWPELCLAAGTQITLSDRTTKNIEDVVDSDELLVWNFDDGKFDVAKPLFIFRNMKSKKYSCIKFSDGSELKSVSSVLGHRIFNKEKGMFTYPMTDDTPVGTHSFNQNGEEVQLVEKSIVDETNTFFNIVTNHHMNLFSNGILTSFRYNNLYPIENMMFKKEIRENIPLERYNGVSEEIYMGMRLYEQAIPVERTLEYLKFRNMTKVT